MPVSEDDRPLGKRASSPDPEQAAAKKRPRRDETSDVVVLPSPEQKLTVLENALAKMSERMECVLCHEIMHEPTTLVPCQHSFCGACVKRLKTPTCPVCRGRVEKQSRNIYLADIIEHFLEAHPDRRSAAKVTADLERDLLATLDESSKKAVGKTLTGLVHGSVKQVTFIDEVWGGPNALQAANAVARGIAHCSSLQSLSLCSWASIGSDCLEVIVTKGVVASSSLSELSLTGNQMTDAAVFAVARALSEDSQQIMDLTLSSAMLSYAAGGKLAEAIKTNSTLQKLDLSCNKIRTKNVKKLAMSLKFNSALRTLHLRHAKITYEGAEDLASALMTNSTLQRLDLSSNEIEDDGAKSMATAFELNSTLQDLNLASNHILRQGAKALAAALMTTSTLQKLDLCSNKIQDDGAECFAKALESNSTLQDLYLANNQIGNVESLGRAIASDSCALRGLNLTSNKIASVNTLAAALELSSSLCRLNLSKNDVRDVKALGEALKTNTSLRVLDLGHNKIETSEASQLVMALKDNGTLTDLNLESNQICNGFTEALEKALPHNSSLLKLDLSSNKLGDACIDQLMAALRNSSLKTVWIWRNNFTDEGKKLIKHPHDGRVWT